MGNYNFESVDPLFFSELGNVISDAISHGFVDNMNLLDLKTKNCGKFLLWDTLYKALLNSFNEDLILKTQKKRGCWELVLLCNHKSNTIFSFMKEKRFQELRKKRYIKKTDHYLESLVLLNEKLQAEIKQTHFTNIDDENPKLREKAMDLLNYLCCDFQNSEKKIIANHVLVCFSNSGEMLTDINAYILDVDFDIVEEKSLVEFISYDIGITENQLDKQPVTTPKLQLSKKALERANKTSHQKLKHQEESKKQID